MPKNLLTPLLINNKLSQDPSRKVGVLFLPKFSDPFFMIVPDEEDDDADDDARADLVPFVPVCSSFWNRVFWLAQAVPEEF